MIGIRNAAFEKLRRVKVGNMGVEIRVKLMDN